MGLFDAFFKKQINQEKENLTYYRANLFQKNIASKIENDSLEIAIGLHHSLVRITDKILNVKALNGETHSFPIRFSEKDFSTTTHIGKFQNGRDFRFIQPKDLSLKMAMINHNALGAFTLGSVNPNGWAVHFYLTEKNDLRQTDVLEKGSVDQIQKLIQGSMMGIKFGVPDKFVEFSKRLLQIIADNPSQLNDFDESDEFIQIMKSNLEVYTSSEISTINKI
jgi:hypothetical protein